VKLLIFLLIENLTFRALSFRHNLFQIINSDIKIVPRLLIQLELNTCVLVHFKYKKAKFKMRFNSSEQLNEIKQFLEL
jgi:hypothetical protein